MGCNCRKMEFFYVVFDAQRNEVARVKTQAEALAAVQMHGGSYKRL